MNSVEIMGRLGSRVVQKELGGLGSALEVEVRTLKRATQAR